mmetsp:Transcript_18617/g.40319  ORF Transcript_18617/g.40319 Transcript_18617/m.40319 type:complete len:258 (+) Transcript_18617:146-919(+)
MVRAGHYAFSSLNMWGFEHLIKGGNDGKMTGALDADTETTNIWKRIEDAQNNGDQQAGSNGLIGAQNKRSDEEYCFGLCSSLTFAERLFGCLIMHVGGYILDLGSLHRFVYLIEGSPLPFVATWTLGHIVCLLGTTFLVGPKKQMEGMFHESRRMAATAYVSSMIVTLLILIVCLVLDRPTGLWVGIVLVVLLLCQCCCIAWYTISYIRFLYDFLMKRLEKLKKQSTSSKNSNARSTANSSTRGWMIWKKNDYEQIE